MWSSLLPWSCIMAVPEDENAILEEKIVLKLTSIQVPYSSHVSSMAFCLCSRDKVVSCILSLTKMSPLLSILLLATGDIIFSGKMRL